MGSSCGAHVDWWKTFVDLCPALNGSHSMMIQNKRPQKEEEDIDLNNEYLEFCKFGKSVKLGMILTQTNPN